jgi:protein-L-isoaspartate(D-aspartate) O-methyltransferase
MDPQRDRVSAAFDAVAREEFLPAAQRSRAAYDGPLPIGHGQTSSQPRTVAAMLRLLEVAPGHRVLDVGAGSGWTTALLAMFSFVEPATFTDGITWGVVFLIAAVASMRARTLPRPVVWVGLVAVAVHLLGIPVQLLLNGTVQGVTGPLSMVCFMLWMLSASLALLIRPGGSVTAS